MSAFRTPIHIAGQPAKGLRPVIKPATGTSGESPSSHHADEDMMHAWSIGVTSAARALTEKSSREKDSCPPEVYIG